MKDEKIENLIRRINFLTTVFMLLPFLATVTALPFLPDLIPAHYDLDGVINRWGSKYESLIVPIITLGIGLLIMLSTKAIADYDKKSRTILAFSGLCVVLMFNIMTYIFLVNDFIREHEEVESNAGNIEYISEIFIIVGVLLIVLGMLITKTKRNGIFGVRTKWSFKTDENWEHDQKVGKSMMILFGVVLILGNTFIFKELSSAIFSIIVIACMTLIIVVSSYRFDMKLNKLI